MRVVPILLLGALGTGPLLAQSSSTPPDSARSIQRVIISAERDDKSRPTALQQLTLPATARVTAAQAARTVNLVDPEDAVKYVPSVFLRKRNNGDTQATIGTRTWGTSSSARTLVFADGVPLTALVANNNTIGGPRWGLVSPEEIARVDMMFGPFSAAYAGNSMGAVMEILTRQPDAFTASLQQTMALQRFSLYGTEQTYHTAQTNVTIGNRFGPASFWLSANHQDSRSQPLSYVTAANAPAGTTGAFTETNKLGAPANVLGATGLLGTGMSNAKLKIAYDLSPWLRAAYSYGIWQNDANSGFRSFLRRSGGETFGGVAGFATGRYSLDQRHSAQSFSLRTDRGADWNAELVYSTYTMGTDQQRFPTTMTAGDTVGRAGRVAVLDGTGWNSVDLRGAWNLGGANARHVIAAGLHADHSRLDNPTYSTTDWRHGRFGNVFSSGKGTTESRAAWVQDAWTIKPTLRLTVGGRFEQWRAFDGFNQNGNTQVTQAELDFNRFSPKAVLAWTPRPQWDVSTSIGTAFRFATPAELYQLVTTGATFTSPTPTLRPDNVLAAEIRARRTFGWGNGQLVLFQDDIHDAIISQFLPLVTGSPTLYSYLSNVDHVRSRGVELTVVERDLLLPGVELMVSGTYLDARTLALSGAANAGAAPGAAEGKFLPNIPKWRATFLATYRPGARLSLSLGGRYSDKIYTTLDNADTHPNTWQGFSEWFSMDAKATWQWDANRTVSLGIDNLLDRKYFLFHPFPQRTVVLGAKISR